MVEDSGALGEGERVARAPVGLRGLKAGILGPTSGERFGVAARGYRYRKISSPGTSPSMVQEDYKSGRDAASTSR